MEHCNACGVDIEEGMERELDGEKYCPTCYVDLSNSLHTDEDDTEETEEETFTDDPIESVIGEPEDA